MMTDDLISELAFKAIRSSGSGGQHVNKVSSKIELSFNLIDSGVLSDYQKDLLKKKLSNRLNKQGILILQCDETRSQHKNKELVIKRFLDLIEQGLKEPKKRKPTKTPKKAIEKRLDKKSLQAKKKALRKKPPIE